MKEYTHYLDYGNGEIVVLLPSNWLSSKSYKSIAKLLSKNFRVIVPDLYRGKSKYTNNALNLSDYVFKLKTFFEDHDIKNFYLIGFSFSGMVAVEYANKYPEYVKKLILISSIKYPIKLKLKDFTLITAIFGYIRLFYHNSKSLKGIKIIFLWLDDGINYFLKHTKQFFLDARISLKDSKDLFNEQIIQTKILVAKKDEFISIMNKVDSNNIKIEFIDGYHTWYFDNEELFVNIVSKYISGKD